MARKCRHIMPSGGQCHGYALHDGELCYFHSRRCVPDGKPAGWIEIPLLEDRCAVQVTLTQVLRAIVNNTVDQRRASLLLYGLQLSLQSVDRSSWAIPIGTVKALSQASDGEELAAEPEYEDDEQEDSDESGDDSDGDDEDPGESGKEDERNGDDDDDDPDNETPGSRQTADELTAEAERIETVCRAVQGGDAVLAARLLMGHRP